MECADCHVKSEDVTYYSYEGEIDMYADLCDECHSKRTSKLPEEGNENPTEKDSEPFFPELGKIDLSSPEKCEELIQRIKNLQVAGRLSRPSSSDDPDREQGSRSPPESKERMKWN